MKDRICPPSGIAAMLTPAAAAEYLGITESELRRLHNSGHGPTCYLLPRRRYYASELAKWKEQRERPAIEPAPIVPLSFELRRMIDELLADSSSRPGWIYFLQAETLGTIKIGFGRNLPQRIADIRGISPVWLDFLGAIPGSMAGEQKLHVFFREFNTHSEWFSPDETLLRFIREITPRFWTRILAKYPQSATRERPVISSVSPAAWRAASEREVAS